MCLHALITCAQFDAIYPAPPQAVGSPLCDAVRLCLLPLRRSSLGMHVSKWTHSHADLLEGIVQPGYGAYGVHDPAYLVPELQLLLQKAGVAFRSLPPASSPVASMGPSLSGKTLLLSLQKAIPALEIPAELVCVYA